MKEIQLTQGKVALVDDDIFEELNKHKWCAIKGRNTYYALRWLKGTQGSILMHHVILPPVAGHETDHIDQNGLNDQRSNLRPATKSQNAANRGPKPGTSRYKGVSWHKKIKKWRSCIERRESGRRKQHHLGYFEKEEMAAQAYDQAARNLFGEFVKTNF